MGPSTCSIPVPAKDQWRDIAVVIAADSGGGLGDGEARLLAAARTIADQFGCYVWAVSLDPLSEATARAAIGNGADAVEAPSAPGVGGVEEITDRLAAFTTSRRPESVLGAPEPILHAALARLAERIQAPFVAGGIALVEDPSARTLSVRVAGYGGRLLTDLVSPTARPFFATVAPESLPPPFPNPGREGEMVFPVEIAGQKVSTIPPGERQN
ncbi:MAG: hypothetical protein HYY93_16560 [Planctomycetes bacterium]|nr:hypothetical protein [Planctomycetota bacterium]